MNKSKVFKALYYIVKDTATMTWRGILRYIRIPEALFFSSVQPVMFVLLFRYVFGGAIGLGLPKNIPYVDYLMPGIFTQTVAFGAIATSIGLAEDLQTGLIERFKTLPMSRLAVLSGRTVADLIRTCFVILLMTGVGYLVGFRIETSVGKYILGILILLLFSYALNWGMALIGLLAPNSETAQVMTFPFLFPLTFASSAFVPVWTMPSWLQGFATYQPVSEIAELARGLMATNVFSTKILIEALAWCVGALIVFFLLSIKLYEKRT